MPTKVLTIGHRARQWGERPDISARSVLVTVFGDTIAPLAGTVWLSDLITMAQPLGFNERLVRTSMFRLVAEGWVENERVGRQSRYSLTPFGRAEFAKADARIYRRDEPAWDGAWTLVFLAPGAPHEVELLQRLGWRGFAELSCGVHALPAEDLAGIRELIEQLRVDSQPLVATARFDDIAALANAAPFRESSGLAEAEVAYRSFVESYAWATEVASVDIDDQDAFVLRTMIVHDLRRARLRDPDLPRDLLPPDWVGDDAVRLAASIYRTTSDASWRYAESVTGLSVDPLNPLVTRRFPSPDRPYR